MKVPTSENQFLVQKYESGVSVMVEFSQFIKRRTGKLLKINYYSKRHMRLYRCQASQGSAELIAKLLYQDSKIHLIRKFEVVRRCMGYVQ